MTILTVVTPATVFDLTDIGTVREELDIGDDYSDRLLARWITETSSFIAVICNRVFAQETVSEQFDYDWEKLDMTYQRRPLRLRRYPLVSVASLTNIASGEVLDPTTYEVDLEKAIIRRVNDSYFDDGFFYQDCWWYQPFFGVTVVYTAGYALPAGVPLPLQQACLLLLKHRKASRTRDPNLRQQTVPGVLEQSWWVPSGGDPAVPPEVELLIGQYRDWIA